MLIAVGSTSDSKLRTARAVYARIDPAARIVAVLVDSAVAAQPTSDTETIRGALHRARESRTREDADYGIGIEGGVHQDEWGVWICAWVAVVDRAGREGLGCGLRLRLPAWMAARALAGEEVGDIVDALLGHDEAHEVLGAVGLLTRGLVDRQAALEQALIAALAPFLSPGHYGPDAER
ncbi:MAG TPA: inosine/xanthosine triphosphatase [bacterium]|nr:inosine/xanthosine triphosphatase [bacterium]